MSANHAGRVPTAAIVRLAVALCFLSLAITVAIKACRNSAAPGGL